MKTGYLTMVEHPVQGWLPANDRLWDWPYAWNQDHIDRWPKPFYMWQPLFRDQPYLSDLIGWIKRTRQGQLRTGHEKPCEICGTAMYVTRSIEKTKRFCSQKCKNVQIGRDRLAGVVF